ncbi:MAG: DUF3817 domain-containing protein [Polyangiales bacterium]
MSSIRALRVATLLEGISFLTLMLVAMPMKYAFGQPMAVTVTGGIHGLLFSAFLVTLCAAHAEHEWGLFTSAKLFVGAVVPFGFLYVERELRDRGPLVSGGEC